MKAIFALIKNLILLPIKLAMFVITLPLKIIKLVFSVLGSITKLIFKVIKLFLNPLVLLLGLGGAAAFVFSCEERRKKVLGMLGL
ncbi:MAG TPA: hypothetical protein VIS94_15580 [Desulfomonilia bacterium]|jgi:hypothetical protein